MTGGYSTRKGCWLPGILVVTLCGGPGLAAVVGTHAGPAETGARVPAGRPPLPRQVLQPVPSPLLLPPALAVDEPSLNQLGEPHTMLRLLGITSSKSTLAVPQGWAGERDLLLLLIPLLESTGWRELPAHCFLLPFTRKSATEPVPARSAETSLCPWEQCSRQAGSCAASREPTRARHLRLAGTRRPNRPAQGNVTGHLHVGRLEGLEETGLSSAAPIAAARDINTGKETSYKWMRAVCSGLP